MDIGLLRETYVGETRAPLIPFAVGELVKQGNRVVVERGTGERAGFADQAYVEMGARIVYSADEVISRSQAVLKVYPPSWEEYQRLEEGQALLSFLQLSHASQRCLDLLVRRRVTAIGYEAIETPAGERPVLTAMSEIAGRLTIPIAAHYLQAGQGGRGTLLDGIPGVPSGVVVVLGAGVVGTNAALRALAIGAKVIVLDRDVSRLRALEARTGSAVVTATVSPYELRRMLPIADVLIGAVLIGREATPQLLNEELIATMKPRSVFIDVSIDQGGCSTTSRPTTLLDQVYVTRSVIHYCVPNIPALVPRTATASLSNILLPYVTALARMGPEGALRAHPDLGRGFYTHDGACLKPPVSGSLGMRHEARAHGTEHEHAH